VDRLTDWGEGPEGDKDVLAFINETPLLLSLLYDLDLLPEQHPDHESPAWEKIFTITNHWREAVLQSLSQEAVRDEAQIQAEVLAQLLGAAILRLRELGETSWELPPYARALKREPNAAAQVNSIPQQEAKLSESPTRDREPAPAAHDAVIVRLKQLAGGQGTVSPERRHDAKAIAETCNQAATVLSLAQTEIKGHMRVEDDLQARVAELEKLAQLGTWVLEETRGENVGCDLDGGSVQDRAEEIGLLIRVRVTEPCGEDCNCTEYGDFPQMCLRNAVLKSRA
jgi:hypothetical protein